MSTTIAQRYEELKHASHWKALLESYSFAGLSDQEIKHYESKGLSFYRGKVRDLLIGPNDIRMIHSDRLTAFDKFITLVPYKGVILTAISDYWLNAVKNIVPTHLISTPAPRELVVKKTKPFKVEVVVRAYLAGSIARAYAEGERSYCGVKLPEGLKNFGPLPELIITPTTKAPVFEHDENISAKDLIAKGLCTAAEWDQIQSMAFKIFRFGKEVLAKHGWILVDTKYEFGKNDAGEIILIDEIHTPDSSRFWVAESYDDQVRQQKSPIMLDKEVVRRWLLAQGYKGEGKVPEVPPEILGELTSVYLQVAEALTGKKLLAPN